MSGGSADAKPAKRKRRSAPAEDAAPRRRTTARRRKRKGEDASAGTGDLEDRIGYRFADQAWLDRALTHSSLANEICAGPGSPLNDNEQLEFLGDSILGFLVAEALVSRYAESREGELSRIKSHLVSAAHLHGVARRLDIGSHL